MDEISVVFADHFALSVLRGYGGLRLSPPGSKHDICNPSGFYWQALMNPRFGGLLTVFNKLLDILHIKAERLIDLGIKVNKNGFNGLHYRMQVTMSFLFLRVTGDLRIQYIGKREAQRRLASLRQENGCECSAGFVDGVCNDKLTPVDVWINQQAAVNQDASYFMANFFVSVSQVPLFHIRRLSS
jgi:hypothetical protein